MIDLLETDVFAELAARPALLRERTPRTLDDGIEILPWRVFLDQLWDGALVH